MNSVHLAVLKYQIKNLNILIKQIFGDHVIDNQFHIFWSCCYTAIFWKKVHKVLRLVFQKKSMHFKTMYPGHLSDKQLLKDNVYLMSFAR